MRFRKGFSRLELVIVLLVLAVLLAVLTPRYIRYARAGQSSVCSFNRATILRLYKAHLLLDPDCTLGDVLAARCGDFEEDVSAYACPGGGVYSAAGNDRIRCSLHGD